MVTGVVQARFQVVHLKHIEYVLAAKMRCDRLFIGITNPDDLYVTDSVNDEGRSSAFANPLTYYERYEMIYQALLEFGVSRDEFDIVPFPIGRPEYVLKYAPREAKYFMTICDEWDEEKKKILTALDLDIEIMWRRNLKEKGVTGSEVRNCIASGWDWEHLVPKSTYRYIMEHGIDQRIKELAKDLGPEEA